MIRRRRVSGALSTRSRPSPRRRSCARSPTRESSPYSSLPRRPHPAPGAGQFPAPFASPIVAVLVGLGLVLGGHVEQALLDLGFVGDLGEPPTLGGHLTKIIS